MKDLYPEIEPYAEHEIRIGQHLIYFEESGNPQGQPVIFLHGGPGSGCKPHHRRFFDADKYRIILFDQRGCGKSLPYGELQDNTTPDLLADMERIRDKLGIKQWLVFGGSWGAALALLYAESHPDCIDGLILRGSFLARDCDLRWYAGGGANRIYPEAWEQFMSLLGPDEGVDLIGAYQRKLHGKDDIAKHRAALNWEHWASVVALGVSPGVEASGKDLKDLVLRVRLELHYAQNHYFIANGQILADIGNIPLIPIMIIHGRRDMVCPIEAAYQLRKALPQAELIILENAGHIAAGEDMVDALVDATDRMARALHDRT